MEVYEQLKSQNELAFRSYYVPFNINDTVKYKYGIVDRTSSSSFFSLNGVWNIKEYENPSLVNVVDETNKTIKVPSCLQLNGFDSNQYTNVNYPMFVNPPFVPKEHNKTWLYKRKIDIKPLKNKKYYVVFEGVDSFFYLYINNKLVGYSDISHAMHEFDVTDYLNENDNEIEVVVLKWSASSYLEDQDKLRFSGIFRDVYMLVRPTKHIVDYKIETSYKDDKGTLSFNHKKYLALKNSKSEIEIDNVKIWSIENPYLYKLELSSNEEKIIEEIGFRNINIEGNKFYFNNELIKIKGMNRHDFNYKTGATLTLKNIYDDLLVIKDLNCNAIRTSHYPNSPDFYKLCSKMGLLVLAEADLESHGFATDEGGYDVKPWNEAVEKGIFKEAIFRRESSLVEMLKNNTCIFMWSLGNESSFGKDFFKGAKYIRSRESRPIHYEGLQNAKKYYYSKLVDVVSMMYPSIETITKEVINNKKETRPFILCEYSHSMGNSNGDLKDYWDLINKHDNLMGGFIWEFKDHGLKINGKYHYGGDFNDIDNDGNFCIDGMVNPDLTYKSNALELKAIYGNTYDESINKIEMPKLEDSGSSLEIKVNKYNASIESILVNNKEILLAPSRFNVERYIDNELHEQWMYKNKYKLDRLEVCNEYSFENNIHKNKGFLASPSRKPVLFYQVNYEVKGSKLIIDFSYRINEYVTNLPRVGIEFIFDKKYEEFSYIGFGPYESYIDKHLASKYGYYMSNTANNYFHYIRPQESGSHYHTDYIMINDLLEITSSSPISFSYNPYTTKELINSKHDYELPKVNKSVLCLDVSHRGIGTHSCGPELDKKYNTSTTGSNRIEINFK